MEDLVCPHCHNTVSHGASVCRGCQAEVEYGTPRIVFIVLLVVSVVMGFKTTESVSPSFSFLGWVVGVGFFVAGIVLLTKFFADRVNFKRIYRTK